MNPPLPPETEPAMPVPPARAPFLWPLFLAAVFGPPTLTGLAAWMDHRGAAAPAIMFLGGAVGGITAGVMVGCRLGKTSTSKALLSLLFCGIMTVAVVSMSGLGCSLGNYRLDFR
ncbi:MAG: hypothetical protein JNK85_02725 [Verrucomicrobiales bacterium]|nr:hypothetical protein [Verrucomicrobiales bacterium]